MKSKLKGLVFVGAIVGVLFAVAIPKTYASSGPEEGSTLTCRPNDARCANNSDCCSKTCIWCGQKNCCR
jgi:hypothetical protein